MSGDGIGAGSHRGRGREPEAPSVGGSGDGPSATSDATAGKIVGAGLRIRRDVDTEIEFHLAMRVRELIGQGHTAESARAEALRKFGDMARTRAVCMESDYRVHRRKKRRELMNELAQDIRVAFRQLRRRPGFALIAILTLAVGIGANTAIFSAADHVLLRPLGNVEPERVVTFWETNPAVSDDLLEVAPGNFAQWEERAEAFSAVGLAEPYGFELTGGEGPPAPASAWLVTEGFFSAAGIHPSPGRAFLPDDYRTNAQVVVISHRLWQSRWDGDPSIVGRPIELDGTEWLVMGVLPADVEYPAYRDVWAPKLYRPGEDQVRTSGYMIAVGRLKPGIGLVEAEGDMNRVASGMALDYPATNVGTGVSLVPLEDHVLGAVRPALLVLLGAVGLVLLVACANVASLMMARAMERERELGVRVALGAGRMRLLRQHGTEAFSLALLGGTAGLIVAWAGVRALVALGPEDLPRLGTIGIDGRIIAFSAVLTVLTALLFGLAPALHALRSGARQTLATSSHGSRGSRAAGRFRSALVVGQISLAMILLVGAGLLGRSFLSLLDNDLGFEVENRAAIQVFLWDRHPTAEQRIQQAGLIEAAMAAVPGVEAVGFTSALPFHPSQIDAESVFRIDGLPPVQDAQAPRAYTTIASTNYFDVMSIRLIRGRTFTEADRMDGPRVTVINETLADRYFAGADPIGERILVGAMDRPVIREIVGIVSDVRPTTFDSDPRPELYVPFAQNGTGGITFVARTRTDATSFIPALRDQIWAIDAAQAIYHAATVEQLIGETLVERRFSLVLLGGLSLVGLLLAVVGVYGLMTFATSQRRAEIAVRMALGARSGNVTGMIVGEALRIAIPGIAIGVAGALYLTRFLQTMLYDIEPTDLLTFVQIVALMAVAATAAAWVPARRAAKTDPMRVLRQD
jgi:putative ABC transport system permease protein